MIGVVVVTHGGVGRELVATTRMIVGETPAMEAIGIDTKNDINQMKAQIAEAVGRVDQGGGVLILTDMFGGSASNLSVPFLVPGRVEVLTGVNLPILLKLATSPRELPLRRLIDQLRNYGQRNIVIASEYLKERGE